VSRGRGVRTQTLIDAAFKILHEIQPASVRAVCYQLFIAKLIENMGKSSTNSISRLLRIARENREIDWEWIVDESRAVESVPSWSGPDALIRCAVRQYRRDYWQDQKYRVEIWSEKGTVRGALAPILNEYGITFRVHHGYTSATVVNDIATISNDTDKPLNVLYIGDWDPSGKHMSDVDLPDRLERYGGNLSIKRVALTAEDLAALPSFDVDTKKSDPRYKWFRKHIGTPCYELDAMSPPQLRARVEAEILKFIDRPKWDHARMVEQVEVASMEDFHKSWLASICSAAAR
jgi:hypothetical protein